MTISECKVAESEVQFGKLGYKKYENKDIIVYYKPYSREDIRYDDITFCKKTKKVILYQGTNYGSDAYRMDYEVLRPIALVCKELGWKFNA